MSIGACEGCAGVDSELAGLPGLPPKNERMSMSNWRLTRMEMRWVEVRWKVAAQSSPGWCRLTGFREGGGAGGGLFVPVFILARNGGEALNSPGCSVLFEGVMKRMALTYPFISTTDAVTVGSK